MTVRKTGAALALMAGLALASPSLAVGVEPGKALEDTPRTMQQAIKQLGEPSVRELLPDGGARLRWVSLDGSVQSVARVTTLRFDAAGKLTASESRRLMSPLGPDKGI